MKKRFLSLFVMCFCLFSAVFGVSCNKEEESKTPPEYSQNSALKFQFWSDAPTDGIYRIDGVEYYTGKDYRTEEQY